MNNESGPTLSHYRLIEQVGKGGMGVVWKAEDTTLRRPVAIKFLTERPFGGDVLRARFLREARLAAALAAGGRIVDASHAPSHWTLSDPAGNRVCICAWPDGSNL